MAKKSVIAGEYVIEIADNGHVDVLRVPRNGKAVMREIAASKNFKIEPKWTNHQLGAKLIKEFGDGTLAEFGDIVMIKQPNGAIEISQKFSNVKASLREIASKIGFQYNPEWNGQMFGRKLVDYLIEHKEEADEILRTPNAKSVKNSSSTQETDELCVEKEDDKRNESASGDYDYYVLGISYEAEHILHVSKESLPSIEDINTNYDEFPLIEGDEITIDNLNDVFERYEGPLNFVQEACDYERRLNLTLITGGHLVKCASEDDDKWEAYHSGGVDSCDVDSSCMHLDYYNRLDAYDLERQSSGELLLCSAYPVIGMSAFALRLPAGDSFEPERLKIKNDEDGSMFSVYYDDEPLEFLFVGDNDPEFADEANYKVFFDGSWIKPQGTDAYILSIRYACDEAFLIEREDSVPTKEQIKEWINDAERGDMELTEEDKSEIEKMSYQDLVKQYIDSCGSIYNFIRASEDYERRISLTDLLETRLYACEDELNPEETAYNADDELTWFSPWGINFKGKHFSLQDFTLEQFVAFGAYHPCLSQYALYLHSGESFEPEALTIEERALKGRSADEWRVLYHGHELERIWNDCDYDGDWLAEKVYYQGKELKELEDKASAVERQKGYWYDD